MRGASKARVHSPAVFLLIREAKWHAYRALYTPIIFTFFRAETIDIHFIYPEYDVASLDLRTNKHSVSS